MTWYNRVLRWFGDWRLIDRGQYLRQVMTELRYGELKVIHHYEHSALQEIAAVANVIYQEKRKLYPSAVIIDAAIQRLEKPLMVYRLALKAENDPPSANRTQEEHLMDISL